jgi:hypothetical protein
LLFELRAKDFVPGRASRAEAISPTAWSKVADGRICMTPEGTADFCGDLREEEQKIVWPPRVHGIVPQ